MHAYPQLVDDSGKWHLPLANHTAMGLYECLLESDSHRLREWFMLDPALLLWISCQLPDSWRPAGLDELAMWASERLVPRLSVEHAGELELPRRGRGWSDLVEQSLGVAGTAAVMAQESPQEVDRGCSPDMAFWVGALIEAAAWLTQCGPSVRQADLGNGVAGFPKWLAIEIQSARQGRKAGDYGALVSAAKQQFAEHGWESLADHPAGEALSADLMRTVELWKSEETTTDNSGGSTDSVVWGPDSDIPGRCLIRLARKLQKLESLEAGFSKRLEEEKLIAMGQLAYGAGHEINNPLANISSRAQGLLVDERDPDRRHQLATISAQSFRAYEMIADMMMFAKPPEPEKQSTSLASMIESLVCEMAAIADQQQTKLQTSLDSEDLVADVDPVQVASALRGLVANSLEALGGGGSISLRYQRTSQWDEITVTDDGPGVSAETRRHMFDPFYSGREAGRGLGLGLSKVWVIAQQHLGEVSIENVTPRGVCVSLKLSLPSQAQLQNSPDASISVVKEKTKRSS